MNQKMYRALRNAKFAEILQRSEYKLKNEYVSNYQFRLHESKTKFETYKINTQYDAYRFIKANLDDTQHYQETFKILFLNRANEVIGFTNLASGTLTACPIDIRMILKYCVESLATGIILSHNHPSGNLEPSQADICVTERIRDVLEKMDVTVCDHIITTKNGFISMTAKGFI